MKIYLKDVCKILKVKNIQQEEKTVSGIATDDYASACEMIAVCTKDEKYRQLFTYDKSHEIIPDLLKSGYISYNDFNEKIEEDSDESQKSYKQSKVLEDELNEMLKDVLAKDYGGISYSRAELGWYKGKMCSVYGKFMHCNGKNLPAFQYQSNDGYVSNNIIKKVGDKESFIRDIKPFIDDYPFVQFIFSYYLSGAIRQVLEVTSEGIGEYGLVTCITGKTGSGKSTVTSTLRNVLFGKGGMLTNNITSVALYKRIRNSGICPVVQDDTSTDTKKCISVMREKVLEIYNIASGRCRLTANCDIDIPLYAPFIESREEDWGIAEMVRCIREVEGYKYRILEFHINPGDLTKDAEAARSFSSLSGKYKGMAKVFLDYLVDNYSEKEISDMYYESVKEMDDRLDENELETRYSNRTAVVLVTAKICEQAYGITMDLERIKDIMINAIYSFEKRIEAHAENAELLLLYKLFTKKDSEGNGLFDKFIVDKTRNYKHAKHYVSLSKSKKTGETVFIIPMALMGILFETLREETQIQLPCFWGYDVEHLEMKKWCVQGSHWKAVCNEWAARGIMICREQTETKKEVKDEPKTFTKKVSFTVSHSVELGGVATVCYKFSWDKLAQIFGDHLSLDKTRFVHDTDEEIYAEEEEIGIF